MMMVIAMSLTARAKTAFGEGRHVSVYISTMRESMENLLASQQSGGMISALATGHIRTPPTLSTAHTHSDHNPSFSSTFPTITSANSSNSLTSFMQQMLTSSLAHRDFPPNPPFPSNSAVAMLAYLQLVHSLSGQDSSQSEWTDRDSVS
ncbi:hypothetical protein TSMEX_000469 [Taenia solium]|eukprot:TsM_000925900 transcript=TsM_000925900 gene=TsM_000925900